MKTDIEGSWAQLQRIEFIEFNLFWNGAVNRSHLVERFTISKQQASADLARYAEVAPGNAAYNRQKKAYQPTPEFRPRLVTPDAGRYLGHLLGITLGLRPRESSSLGFIPEVDAVPSPRRQVDATVLRGVLKASRERWVVIIDYQSMSRESDRDLATTRSVSPHALVHDGVRWHMRAFCHRRNEFRDFVLSRVLTVHLDQKSSVHPEEDVQWRTYKKVILAPAPELTAPQKSAVEHDYGMANGTTELVVREALLFYVLQQLGSSSVSSSEQTRHIVVVNENELRPLVVKGAR